MHKKGVSKNILFGITGGVAAYKSLETVRLLKEAGHTVRVIMTKHATAFATPLSFQALSGNTVYTELMDETHESAMRHIELAQWADMILIAPATANIISKLTQGLADDLLSTVCLASTAPLFIAPAMNKNMWEHSAVQHNMKTLCERGAQIIGPDSGLQACGDVGFGRMSEPSDIVDRLLSHITFEKSENALPDKKDSFEKNENALPGKKNSLERNENSLPGKKVLITAGATREFIDPIRYITNKSSGKMGYALAETAALLGADVLLISASNTFEYSKNIRCISVTSALEMHDVVMQHASDVDIFISVAAVTNYRVENAAKQKIKSDAEKITLALVKNPDIIQSVAALPKKPFIIGFAAETDNVIAYAEDKLHRKMMDMIVANDVSDNQVMGSDSNTATIIDKSGRKKVLPEMSKKMLAQHIFEFMLSHT